MQSAKGENDHRLVYHQPAGIVPDRGEIKKGPALKSRSFYSDVGRFYPVVERQIPDTFQAGQDVKS